MTWLVWQKVLPSLLTGQPPSYQTILNAQKDDPVIGWRLAFDNRDVGWALSETRHQENGMVEICSRVHFSELPLAELTATLSKMFNCSIENNASKLALDAMSTLSIDPLGKMARFDSTIRPKVLSDPIRIQGVAEGSKVQVTVNFRDYANKVEMFMPQNGIVGDALSPQTHLPNLSEGQTWTVPSFSPFRSAGNSMEIQIAKVEGREPISWDDQFIDAWLVIYRDDPGKGLGNSQVARNKLWVADDGRVLKQQAEILNSVMTFTRMSDSNAKELAKQAATEEE